MYILALWLFVCLDFSDELSRLSLVELPSSLYLSSKCRNTWHYDSVRHSDDLGAWPININCNHYAGRLFVVPRGPSDAVAQPMIGWDRSDVMASVNTGTETKQPHVTRPSVRMTSFTFKSSRSQLRLSCLALAYSLMYKN